MSGDSNDPEVHGIVTAAVTLPLPAASRSVLPFCQSRLLSFICCLSLSLSLPAACGTRCLYLPAASACVLLRADDSAACHCHVTAQVIFETDATVVSGAESSADGGMFLHQMGRQVSKAADSMQFVLAAAEGLEIGLPVAEV